MSSEDDIMSESQLWISEDTIKKNNGKWVNKGEDGEHGEFKTKKEADAQRKAIFASGWHESLQEGNSLGRLFSHMNDGVNFAIIGSLDKDDITKSHWNELLDLSINNYKLMDKLERANRRVSWKYLTGRYTMESTGETITEKSIILYNITREVADHLAQSIN